MTRNIRDHKRTKLEAEMGEIWKQSIDIPKRERKQMEVEVKDSMVLGKEMIQDKDIKQRRSRVWDLGKFQVTTLE